jgi:hypothetical protein
MKKSARQFPS